MRQGFFFDGEWRRNPVTLIQAPIELDSQMMFQDALYVIVPGWSIFYVSKHRGAEALVPASLPPFGALATSTPCSGPKAPVSTLPRLESRS